ncbi:MAG TPA: LPS export ABC transporter periplasmic protein LptC [Ignavibacteriaceae bacterium]
MILIVFISCTKEKVKPLVNTNIEGGELPAQESWNSTVFFTDSGKTRAILQAGHLRVFEDSKETIIDSGLQVDFYNTDEIKTTTLTSKRGKVDEKTDNLFAIDSVVASNDSGVVIRTDMMMWRNQDKKIVSDKYVRIESPKEIIEGYGFESDQHLQNYVIYNITYITTPEKK